MFHINSITFKLSFIESTGFNSVDIHRANEIQIGVLRMHQLLI